MYFLVSLFIKCTIKKKALHTEIYRHLKKCSLGTSLVVQWLRLHLPVQGVWVRSLVRELRSHMPCGQKNRT